MASAVPGSIVAVTSLALVSSDQRGKWFFFQRGNIASTSVEGVLLYQNTLTQHRQKKKRGRVLTWSEPALLFAMCTTRQRLKRRRVFPLRRYIITQL